MPQSTVWTFQCDRTGQCHVLALESCTWTVYLLYVAHLIFSTVLFLVGFCGTCVGTAHKQFTFRTSPCVVRNGTVLCISTVALVLFPEQYCACSCKGSLQTLLTGDGQTVLSWELFWEHYPWNMQVNIEMIIALSVFNVHCVLYCFLSTSFIGDGRKFHSWGWNRYFASLRSNFLGPTHLKFMCALVCGSSTLKKN